MNAYDVEQLSEEVFGHLCSIAIDKCNDKAERRKASCGGRSMRKRVLIKNFVSDLLKKHNQNGEDEVEEEYEDAIDLPSCDDGFVSNNSLSYQEPRSFSSIDSKGECWLSDSAIDPPLYSDVLLNGSFFEGRDDAFGGGLSLRGDESLADEVGSVLYDSSTVNETDPLSRDLFSDSYIFCDMSNRYGVDSLVMAPFALPLPFVGHLEPTHVEESDQMYLSNVENHQNLNMYSEMITYKKSRGVEYECDKAEDVMVPPRCSTLIDLDMPCENVSKKRSLDRMMLDENSMCHKRLKL